LIMEWNSVTITAPSEMIDIIVAELMDYGIEAVEILDDYENLVFLENNPKHWDYIDDTLLGKERGDGIIRFHVPIKGGEALCEAISAGLSARGYPFSLDCEIVDDSGWLNEWKKHYNAFKIGERLVICPIWEEYHKAPGEVVFRINPGHVFGTGQHQSTRLMLERLADFAPGANMLDIGCGSGILAISALLLGAKKAVALDIEEAAVDITRENAEINGIAPGRLDARCVNLLTEKNFDEIYDFVCANIVSDVIIKLAPIVSKMIAPNGIFLTGGIIGERAEEVKTAIMLAGFDILGVYEMDDWRTIAAKYNA